MLAKRLGTMTAPAFLFVLDTSVICLPKKSNISWNAWKN